MDWSEAVIKHRRLTSFPGSVFRKKETAAILVHAQVRVIFNCRGGPEFNVFLTLPATAANRKLFPPRISSSSLVLHVTCVISSQSSLHYPLSHLHWSLSSNKQLTPVSRSQTVLFCMLHLNCGRSLLLFWCVIITQLFSIIML